MGSDKKAASSLGDTERQALERLDPELRDHGLLSERVYNLIGKILERAGNARLIEISQSRKVTTFLLSRIQNDHRCTALLALRGYAEQACTLAASIYEASITIAAVASDDSIAQSWIDHSDPNRPFRDVLGLTVAALKRLGIPDVEEAARKRYLVYRQLCLVKHLNPLFMTQRGYEVVGNTVTILSGPDLSEGALRLAQFAFEHSTGMAAFVAATIFLRDHVSTDCSEIFEELRSVQSEWTRLNETAAQRWGTENPFPDRWRKVTP